MREIVTTCDLCARQSHQDARQIGHGLSTSAQSQIHLCVECTRRFDRWMESERQHLKKEKAA